MTGETAVVESSEDNPGPRRSTRGPTPSTKATEARQTTTKTKRPRIDTEPDTTGENSGRQHGSASEETNTLEEQARKMIADAIKESLERRKRGEQPTKELLLQLIARDFQRNRDETRQQRDEAQRQHEETRKQLKETRQLFESTLLQFEDTQRRLAETQGQLAETQRQLEDSKSIMGTELKQVREQLDTILKSPAITASTQTSPQVAYAEIARTPPTSQPTNLRTLSSLNTTPSNFSDTLFCTVDISRVEEADRAKTTAGTIRTVVEEKIRAKKNDNSWRCKAVTLDAKNTNRIKIICRDEAEHAIVKQAVEGTQLANGMRVLRDELYPVKVDNVNRTAVLDESGNIRPGAAEAFGQENETTVAKMSWLSKRDIPKAYGSMVVYLTKAADARRILEEGYFHVGGESGYTNTFERRPRPEQCYNCQEVGHKAFKCRKPQRCARCAKEGHRHDDCREELPRCIPCGGPHESFSRNCPKLYPGQHE